MKYLLLLLPLGLAACGKTLRSAQRVQTSAEWTELNTLTTATTLDTLVEIPGDSLHAILDLQCDTCGDGLVFREVYGNGMHIKAAFNGRTLQLETQIYAAPRRVPVNLSQKITKTTQRSARGQQQQIVEASRTRRGGASWWWYVAVPAVILLIIITKFSKR